jgi:hypothetical protein
VVIVEGRAATRVGWRPGRSSDSLIETAPHPDCPRKGAEEGAVKWYSPPDAGQLWGRHVSLRLWLLPPSSWQLRRRHVSRAERGGGGVVPTSRLRAAPGPPRVAWASAPVSRRRVAPGTSHIPAALAPTSQLMEAPGAPHVPVAPAPTSRLRAALEAPHVVGRKRGRRSNWAVEV